MSRFRSITFLLFLHIFAWNQVAGQDAEFSQFYANPLYINPALAGTSELGRMAVNYRSQWPQNGVTYTTYAVSFDHYSDRYRTGWGIQMLHDRQLNDIIRQNAATLQYSYHIKAGDWSHISAGIQAGITRKQFNPANLIFPSMIDQLTGDLSGMLPGDLEATSKTYADLGAGILFRHNDVFGGFSLHHLNRPDESIIEGDQKGNLPVKFTGHAGASLFRLKRGLFSREFLISPNVIYRHQGNFKQMNLGLYFIDRAFLLGGWFRHNLDIRPDALIFLAGISNQHFQFGYSFDYTLSGLTNYSYGSHEISLTFYFGRLAGWPDSNRLLIPTI